LMVLESAKATMEVPSPVEGVVAQVLVAVGDRVVEGTVLLQVEVADAASAPAPVAAPPAPAPEPVAPVVMSPATPQPSAVQSARSPAEITIPTPDIGSDSADLIEWLVKPGQAVAVDTPLAVLESAKATMEVPSPAAGTVTALLAVVGGKVAQGTPLLRLAAESAHPVAPVFLPADEPEPVTGLAATPPSTPSAASLAVAEPVRPSARVHCGPAVRRLARELGVDLGQVPPTGPKGRILKEDVHGWVKQVLTAPPTPPITAEAPPTGLPPLPEIDFSKWGEVERQPLTRIQALSAQNLHRAWVNIPHVTQFDEADISELEAFRVREKDGLKKQGVNLTVLAFLVRACARLLEEFPRFNASLAADGQTLILKKYVHVGVAVDTPGGLVVPVIRDANRKTVREIAAEMAVLSAKARDRKLSPAEMQGGCFSISSLGGIGGTAFTPIVNWPEVAILGVSRSAMKPVWDGSAFQPRLMLPLSLSYDHRVIDGADAARFTTRLAQVLSDIRLLLL